MNKGKYPAQTMDEMITDMEAKKQKALTLPKSQSLYKKESGEYQEEKLKDLIQASITELVEVATNERVSLADIDEIKSRTVCYLRACMETGTFPNSLGLARSLGYSDKALRHWRKNNPNSKTAQWLELFNDMCADIMSQSALKNNCNNIMAIFINKALYEMRETSEVIVTPNTGDDREISAEEIRERYLTDDNN